MPRKHSSSWVCHGKIRVPYSDLYSRTETPRHRHTPGTTTSALVGLCDPYAAKTPPKAAPLQPLQPPLQPAEGGTGMADRKSGTRATRRPSIRGATSNLLHWGHWLLTGTPGAPPASWVSRVFRSKSPPTRAARRAQRHQCVTGAATPAAAHVRKILQAPHWPPQLSGCTITLWVLMGSNVIIDNDGQP
ncbi:hypothetical protein SKAU_G00126960 [Synaphobranchus kaupii]|uniref:Uncharacterized protein n=1 Tax=Synaphobranchus kaupii TaxID=118154 RepID=A0A9Q1FPM4_SYNKA|nr:hypothetical protein SKAU_G00126960 [Synaphobranchus kaupii]